MNTPSKLYHGTPNTIHDSPRPFLDPALSRHNDEGDPTEPAVFASAQLAVASLFVCKYPGVKSILHETGGQPALIYRSPAPPIDKQGNVYELPADGFEQTVRRGQPTGKWARTAVSMPMVPDTTGALYPGLPVTAPVRRVGVCALVQEDGLRVYELHRNVNPTLFNVAVREAIHASQENAFIDWALGLRWLKEQTHMYEARRTI